MSLLKTLLMLNEGGLKQALAEIADLMAEPESEDRDYQIRNIAVNMDLEQLKQGLMRMSQVAELRGDKTWDEFFAQYELFRVSESIQKKS